MIKVVPSERKFKKLSELEPKPGQTFVNESGDVLILILEGELALNICAGFPRPRPINSFASYYKLCDLTVQVEMS